MSLDIIVKLYKALADENRIRILNLLMFRTCCVCELAEIIGIKEASISRHMKILREARFISDEKIQNWVIYSINKNIEEDNKFFLNHIKKSLLNDPKAVKDIEEAKVINKCDFTSYM